MIETRQALLKEEFDKVKDFLASQDLILDDDCDTTIYLEENNKVIGTIRAIFRNGEKKGTCFLIESNVVATAATNVYDSELGGKAKEIFTTFSEEKVKGENVLIITGFEKRKSRGECMAVFTYPINVLDEWLGVEMMAQDVEMRQPVKCQ